MYDMVSERASSGADRDGVGSVLSDPVMESLQRAIDDLADEDRAGWSNAALSDRLVGLLDLRARLDAEMLALIGRWDARSAWADDGARSPRAWLDTRADLTRRDIAQLVRSGRTVFAHDRIAKSLDHRDLSPAHVDILARANTAGREELFADHEDTLVDSAVAIRTVTDFETAVRQWTAAADDIVDRRRAREIDGSYGIDLSETLHGTVRIDGLLSPEAGALVRNALETEPDPLDCEPRRSVRQRRADQLTDLCRREITDPRQGRGSGAEILVHVDYDTLVGIRGTGKRPADARPAAGSTNHPRAKASRTRHEPHRVGSADRSPEQTHEIRRARGDIAGDRPATRSPGRDLARLSITRHELDGSGPIRPSTVRHMACDGVLRRVVVDRDGEILDLGRRRRVVSDAQRRVVTTRDRHCRFPGCRAPARNCQVHHLVEWAHGGPTDLDNLCLTCWHHHRLIHTTAWTLHRTSNANRYTATRPDGTQIHDPPDSTQDPDPPIP